MPRVSLKERERKLLFDLVCDNLMHLDDTLRTLEDDGAPDEELREWRTFRLHADALAEKLARAKKVPA